MTPGLLKDGSVIVGNYKLDSKEKIRSTRSSIGYGGNKVFLIVARGVTNFELAYVHKAVGSENALALDGGGSVGMFYNGSYVSGPGRAPANAIVLKNR
jgi:exopolysaccharide biosynthesis protein